MKKETFQSRNCYFDDEKRLYFMLTFGESHEQVGMNENSYKFPHFPEMNDYDHIVDM